MKAEFYKDEIGNIWFYYATNIQSRSRMKPPPVIPGLQTATTAIDQAKQKAQEQEEKEDMLAEIEEYKAEADSVKNKCIDRMLGIMDGYYSNMKQDMGIAE